MDGCGFNSTGWRVIRATLVGGLRFSHAYRGLESTGRLLRMYGHEVTVFHHAQNLLDALNIACPDLILSDIGMPQH